MVIPPVRGGAGGHGLRGGTNPATRGQIARLMRGPSARTAARSISCSSSRTFPGQS